MSACATKPPDSSRGDSPNHPPTPLIGSRSRVGVPRGRRITTNGRRFTRGTRLHNFRGHFHQIVIDSPPLLDKVGRRNDTLFKNLIALDALTHLMIESGANRFGHDCPCFPVSRVLTIPPVISTNTKPSGWPVSRLVIKSRTVYNIPCFSRVMADDVLFSLADGGEQTGRHPERSESPKRAN
jgi:hypothetical protein